jgi:hypothetical protein
MEDSDSDMNISKERSRDNEDSRVQESSEEKGNKSIFKPKRRVYTINEKIKIANEAFRTSIRQFSRKYV